MKPGDTAAPARLPIVALAVPFFALLYRAAGFGPDFPHYWEWGEAALSGNIFAIRSATLSPMNVPTSVWAHGTGMILVVAQALLGASAAAKSVFVGWLAAMALWWALTRLLVLAAGGRSDYVLFGAALAFVATHAGFYSILHATESLSLALVATLGIWVLDPRPIRGSDGVVSGVVSGLILITRPQLLPYAILGLSVLAYRARAGRERSTTRGWVTLLAPASLALAVAGVQVALVNRWMTGSPFHSAWSFAGAGFSSFAVTDPEWLAVLFHPWHGLLIYHPLYGLGLAVLVLEIATRRTPTSERALYVGLLVVLLLEIYVQAAWFCWWMGTSSFGSRGMAVSAVVLVPVIVQTMVRREARGASAAPLWAAALFAALWSYLLLIQGESNFYNYGSLWRSQVTALGDAWATILAASCSSALAARFDRGASSVPLAAAAALWSLCAVYLYGTTIPAIGLTSLSSAVEAASAGLLGAVLYVLFARTRIATVPSRLARTAVALGMLLVFATVTVRFTILAIDLEEFIASGQAPPRRFAHAGTVPLGQIEASLEEYVRVDGFDRKKAALAQFLQEAMTRGALPLHGRRSRR